MRPILRDAFKLSQGERARALAFLLVGVSSATLGFLAVLHLDKGVLFNGLSSSQAWIVCAATIGGLLALFLSGDRMGQPGPKGVAQAVAGGIWITFVGALIGGTLGLPFYGTMFGPFIVTVTFAGAPVLALLWICNLTSTHILLRKYHIERDSIFTAHYDARTDAATSAKAQKHTIALSGADCDARPAPYHAQSVFKSESGGLT